MQENSKKDRPSEGDGKKQYKKRFIQQDFIIPGIPNGVKVPDASYGALEKSLGQLKRQMKDVGTMDVYRAKQEFIKPSAVSRRKMKDARYKQRLRDKISAEFWKNHVWLVPKNFKSKNYGPTLPE